MICRILCALLTLNVALAAQGDAAQRVEQRLQKLEAQNRELTRRVQAFDEELERTQFRDVIPSIGESRFGLGPAASKVYGVESGVSIGGYGEYLYEQRSGATDRFDALRSVFYIGHKFDEKWVFNSEIEIEHGTTATSSGTTSSSGSVSLEFGALEYLHDDAFNVRAGLLLVPMGLVNEYHEPTTFLTAKRSDTESRIIPTTWRAMGVGAFGDYEGFSYRAYLINSLDGEEFGAAGLRGGRQKGNRAAADDFAGVLRLDWVGTPGLLVGASAHYGKTGQDGRKGASSIPSLDTLLVDAHIDYHHGPFQARALVAVAHVDGAAAFNTATSSNLASRLEGYYVELGYDVMAHLSSDSSVSLTPYVRFEHVDTQASMPRGFAPDRTREDDILTLGIQVKPIDQVVMKIDFTDRDRGDDSLSVLFGYIF